jgi:UPF0716 protein FxsA
MGTIGAMFAVIAATFLVMSIIELYVLVQVGQAIGALNTIGLVILISLVGAWLAKREGVSVLQRLRMQLDAGRMPTNELVDGVLILAGGILLVTPGFVTDIIGISLLFPPTRAAARALLKRRFRVQVLSFGVRHPRPSHDGPGDIIDV